MWQGQASYFFPACPALLKKKICVIILIFFCLLKTRFPSYFFLISRVNERDGRKIENLP